MDNFKKNSWLQRAVFLCIAFLLLNMIAGNVRFGTKIVCIDMLKMGDNQIVRKIVPATRLPGPTSEKMKLKWDELYPFMGANPPIDTNFSVDYDGNFSGLLARLKDMNVKFSKKFAEINHKCPDYIQPGQLWLSAKVMYDKTVGFSLNIKRQNTILFTSDGYLTAEQDAIVEQEVQLAVDGMKRLQSFCRERNIPMLYMQLPMKISDRTDPEISGKLNMGNQNADRIVAALRENNIDCLDLRDYMQDFTKEQWHGMFFRTDHHWRPEGALWGARITAGELNRRYGFNIDTEKYNPDNFRKVVMEKSMFGSRGQALGKGLVEPDDTSLFYPKYKTYLEFDLPDEALKLGGPFSIIYDMSALKTDDLYHAYGYGTRTNAILRNKLVDNGIKLLVLRDSYGAPEIPFLALGVSQVDALDVRSFSGSVETYIERLHPSVVVVQYSPGALVNHINHAVNHHSHIFDFR